MNSIQEVQTEQSELQTPQSSKRIGELLVSGGWITNEQLRNSVERQRQYGGRLGDIVSELYGVSPHAIQQLTDRNQSKARIGEMLVESGAITEKQLEQALEFQRKSGGKLGDILLSLKFVEPDRLYREIATQQQMGRIGKEFSFEHEARLPEATARAYDAVVINKMPNRYLIAVGAPLAEAQIAALEAIVGAPIEQVLATRKEMENFWKAVYEPELMQASTAKLMEENPGNSAHITFTTPQLWGLCLLALVIVAGLVWNWFVTLIVLNIIVQAVYFVMSVFKFAIILKGTKSTAQLRFTDEQLRAVDERDLPVYTILVPMYKESEVIPHLLENLERLDYPKSKLDVRLLIEEDDVEAQELLQSMDLPAYYTVLIVPHSLPKTKPKACNYGLIRARGEYVVIYDAEDRPDPDQLKKVILSFRQSPEHVACIQAKLNYFNSDQNLLTRWFTHEYSMWFELLLPGIMRLNYPIPLGGTSNHFKTAVLKELNAWDPYNVTEDADLGIRLYKEGYMTAVVDSRTWEEANSRVGNWVRQRSRWIKGYMQTWLVHMRNPVRLWKEIGPKGFFGFQALVASTPILPLINPIFWTLLILWYGWEMEFVPKFFPGIIYYMAAIQFLIGNFLFVLSNVAGVYWVIEELERKKERVFSYGIVKYALLTPIYWVLMSIAAYKALWQLITKPFYWEKTTHGLTGAPSAPAKAAAGRGV
ncbi:glycosyltransferase family 2 protein [Paenibacillus apiarius]|uniref:Glycosyltransferase n=1 Tax=Paenibacillus apiarius TaxID=46240 RepID=A0ABT4DW18_9BACL|nr:glycosyltransferase family 2 protein [Paenibacillus apiarius]MCY9513103.1 glycosyltransferase [Paenibacillus apiarius]MCY9521539.1 glycosyltransferase [Paenibacillus apiarius]MCY9551693.1 glycosyltransferase [Paenibacillus apiarius]MCY9560519.1 glycosyltransferase [Paenibacillus apiarius]MCY9685231.1 glycosyltransferase [Paenibacillus apiarius]